MNVLLTTIAYPHGSEQRNIYTDLLQEFKQRGNDVYVITSLERRHGGKTELHLENSLNILRVKTGNITEAGLFEKGMATLSIEGQFIRAVKKYFRDIKFDLVLSSTPPVTFERLINYVKRRDAAISYLLLKDIFPQNAVDIGLMRKGSLIWRYFRRKETNLYKHSDYIGCMSEANVKYLLEHNKGISTFQVEVCPNSIKPNQITKNDLDKAKVRKDYGIPQHAVIFIYGGNLGKPQGIAFLLEVIQANRDKQDRFFLIAGSGTEYGKAEQFITEGKYGNAKLIRYLPKTDYDKLVTASDAGLIFLDKRFSIPNFPSRILTYMESSLPVLAATDRNTDLKDVIEDNNFGLWVQHGDLDSFNICLNTLCGDSNLRVRMGANARAYLLKEYTVSKCYGIIIGHITGVNPDV